MGWQAVKIQLNGKEQEIEKVLSIKALLEGLKINAETVVVEHNLCIVKKALYPETILRENDCVEILSFMGGG